MLQKIKQLFCRHDYEKEFLHGFLVVDGWLQQAHQYRCKKCGKVRR